MLSSLDLQYNQASSTDCRGGKHMLDLKELSVMRLGLAETSKVSSGRISMVHKQHFHLLTKTNFLQLILRSVCACFRFCLSHMRKCCCITIKIYDFFFPLMCVSILVDDSCIVFAVLGINCKVTGKFWNKDSCHWSLLTQW